MEDVFKKVLYAGAGLAALATEKVTATIDDLVEKGKITDQEGKKILEDFFKNTEAKKEEFEAKLKDVTESVVEKFDFVKKNGVVKDLVDRLEKIEEAIMEGKAEAEKKTTRTRSAKKETSAA